MKFNFKQVYITGGSGWLGKSLLYTLLHGDELVLREFEPISSEIFLLELNRNNYSKKSKIKIIEGDIRSSEDCDRFMRNNTDGILFHCAGIIHPGKVSDFYEINYNGTKNLVNSAIKNKIKKIVVVSSNSPVGCNKTNDYLFTEKSPYNPYMNYGNSKKLMEEFLLKKIKKGVDITIIRPPWFYGENMPQRQLTFYKMVKNGRFPIIGDGTNIRSKANVKNIVQGLLLSAMLKKSMGQIYWIADEKPYSMNEIVNTIVDVLENEFQLKCKINKISLPFFIGQFFQFADYLLQKIGFYSQKIHVASELNKNIACSIEKAKRDLGYNPKISLYDGIKHSLKHIDFENEFS
tara:strand:- start:223 stop:1266 length:1044 start_codon:yes stop_codon:yes gene_type:complete